MKSLSAWWLEDSAALTHATYRLVVDPGRILGLLVRGRTRDGCARCSSATRGRRAQGPPSVPRRRAPRGTIVRARTDATRRPVVQVRAPGRTAVELRSPVSSIHPPAPAQRGDHAGMPGSAERLAFSPGRRRGRRAVGGDGPLRPPVVVQQLLGRAVVGVGGPGLVAVMRGCSSSAACDRARRLVRPAWNVISAKTFLVQLADLSCASARTTALQKKPRWVLGSGGRRSSGTVEVRDHRVDHRPPWKPPARAGRASRRARDRSGRLGAGTGSHGRW